MRVRLLLAALYLRPDEAAAVRPELQVRSVLPCCPSVSQSRRITAAAHTFLLCAPTMLHGTASRDLQLVRQQWEPWKRRPRTGKPEPLRNQGRQLQQVMGRSGALVGLPQALAEAAARDADDDWVRVMGAAAGGCDGRLHLDPVLERFSLVRSCVPHHGQL